MEERKILRGNFTNIFTKKEDFSLARSSDYVLKITEGNTSYFYKVSSDGNVTDLGSPPKSWFSCVLTEWDFLPLEVRRHHITRICRRTHSNFDENLIREEILNEKEKYSNTLYDWADKFGDLLPKEIVLKVYHDLECEFKEDKFKSISHKKTYRTLIPTDDVFERDAIYQVDVYLIDNSYYLYLARELLGKKIINKGFRYQIKSSAIIKKENAEFQKNVISLKKDFPDVPKRLITFLLNAASRDITVTKKTLQDILKVRKRLTSADIDYYDIACIEDLTCQAPFIQNIAFERFLTNWKSLKTYFRFSNPKIKNELANYMTGKNIS